MGNSNRAGILRKIRDRTNPTTKGRGVFEVIINKIFAIIIKP